jgi:hypothetical protein
MKTDNLLAQFLAHHAASHVEAPYDVEDVIAKRRKEAALGRLEDANAALARAAARMRIGSDLERAIAAVRVLK